MATVITINGVTVDQTKQFQIHRLDLSLDEAASFDFSLYGQGPQLRSDWGHGALVIVTVDGSAVPNFNGKIRSISQRHDNQDGWIHAYRAQGMRGEINRIPITSSQFTGTITYNLPTTDPFYDPSNASLSVGTMIQRVLDLHRPTLNAAGLGPQSGPGGPVYLSADFTAGWANVVPTVPVTLAGPRFMNAIDNVLGQWAGNVACWPEYVATTGDWRLRFVDTTALSNVVTITLDQGAWEPPQITSDTINTFTRVVVRGRGHIEPGYLSLKDGTLANAWTSTQQTNWNWQSFATPSNAVDQGTINTLTSVTAAVHSADSKMSWTVNQWSGQGAWVYLINAVATDITITEARIVTSNTTMSAGGSGTINWAGDRPLDAGGYTKYHLIGQPGGGASDVYRLFNVVPPAIAQHMDFELPRAAPWGNASAPGTIGGTAVSLVRYPIAAVDWNTSGSPPDISFPLMGMTLLRASGQIRFSEPVVKYNNAQSDLDAGGATVKQVDDVRVMVPFVKAPLQVECPAGPYGYGYGYGSGYGYLAVYDGTGFTVYNIQDTYYEDMDNWLDPRDASAYQQLACMRLATLHNVVYDGSTTCHDKWMPGLTLGTAVNFTGPTYTTGWEAINCPIRKVSLVWPPAGEPGPWTTIISFNNRRQVATGENVFIHPAFLGGFGLGFGDPSAGLFSGGAMSPGGVFGGQNQGQVGAAQADVSGPDLSGAGVQGALDWTSNLGRGATAPEGKGVGFDALKDIAPGQSQMAQANEAPSYNAAAAPTPTEALAARVGEDPVPTPTQALHAMAPSETPAESLRGMIPEPGPGEMLKQGPLTNPSVAMGELPSVSMPPIMTAPSGSPEMSSVLNVGPERGDVAEPPAQQAQQPAPAPAPAQVQAPDWNVAARENPPAAPRAGEPDEQSVKDFLPGSDTGG